MVLNVFSIFLIVCCWAVVPCRAESVRGMYGVSAGGQDKEVQQLLAAQVTSVFVPPDQQTIRQYKKAGLQVYLTLNVFGGSGSWKKYPDSVPITASGKAVSAHNGGVCPTHFAWREERLALLASWLKTFGKAEGIDGVWLDFIRYPGRWEEVHPEIPDTCYCPRCLELFQIEKGVKIPGKLQTHEAAAWIHKQAELQWLQWKQEQITSFVREARSLVEASVVSRQVKIGLFLVPWTQGERQGAVLMQLAQDASQLAQYADVLSPMVYQKMVGESVEWVGDISGYFGDMSARPVWPIIQAGDVRPGEFAESVRSVSRSGAEGLLVYSFPHMHETLWPLLKGFEAQKNLLPNPQFEVNAEGANRLPTSWQQGYGDAASDSRYHLQAATEEQGRSVGITAGFDRRGAWRAALPRCEPQKSYTFSADFFREHLQGTAYPEIEVWGKRYLLNTHRVVGRFQPLRVSVQCPENLQEEESFFSFENSSSGSTFWLRNPQLMEEVPRHAAKGPVIDPGFFPVGSYGATVENIALLREAGLNSAVLPMNAESVDACIANDMHCLLSVPHDPQKLLPAVQALDERLRTGRFSFYVNDEPEIHSFPRWKARDIQRILHDRFPGMPTSMAIVRPQGIADYAGSADFFMLDQYPVPSMPMTWLSESMDQAAASVGRDRLQSVIQAFGGSEWASSGWPRLPTFAEMNCLAFLSVIHGSRGIYFYTFPIITATEQGKKDFQQVVSRLQKLQPWLQTRNRAEAVPLEMESTNRFDPAGRPAVHCVYKEKESERMVLCVNTLPTYTRASVSLPVGGERLWWEFYDGGRAMAVNGALQIDFLPLEVKVFVEAEQ